MSQQQQSQPPQQQEVPGTTGAMEPRPDHGEESYRGSGKMEGKATVITGADSGIGKAVAIAFAREAAGRCWWPATSRTPRTAVR
jgi:hypothetical protein